MNCVMPAEAFSLQASHRVDDGLLGYRDLVFDDGVNGRMQAGVGNVDLLAGVVRLDEMKALPLVERQPLA
jgi:hypothetical protein